MSKYKCQDLKIWGTKMQELTFLRELSDFISNVETDTVAPDNLVVNVEEVNSDETPVMVPPLQQELELIKKIANVDSIYDHTCNTPPCNCAKNQLSNEENDELQIIRKNAGLGPNSI